MSDLVNQSIVVTGAAGAIGQALVRQLTDRGACVVMMDRNGAGLEALYDDIHANAAIKPIIVETDFQEFDESMAAALREQIQSTMGHLDALIHCANFLAPLAPIEHIDVADLDKTIAVNLRAPYLLTQACLPLMCTTTPDERRRKLIFSVSDTRVIYKSYWTAYAAVSAGLTALVATLADEFENRGVDVYGLDPGDVQSSWQATAFPGRKLPDDWTAKDVANHYGALLDGKDIHGNRLVSGALVRSQTD